MNTPSLFRFALFAAATLFALPSQAETIFILTDDGKLATTSSANVGAHSTPLTVSGITSGESLVAIDVRPQNQKLYALGVNATTNTATLYLVNPATGFAGVVGTTSAVALTTDGTTPVDFPDPATVAWDIDFNPSADRVRVVAGSLNFRINPNTGGAVDGQAGTTGTNPDGAINGGTTTTGATAYTNSQPNTTITTQYTVDATTDSLFIQNPPNNGTQTLGQAVTLGGSPLDFARAALDIAPGVNAASSNTAVASGNAFLFAQVAAVPGLYSLNLVTAQATLLGNFGLAVRSVAIRTELSAAIALTANGATLVRFDQTTPGTSASVAVTGVTAGETLVGIDARPQTGQLMGLGVNATANTGTLYIIDPQTSAVTAVGAASGIAFVDGAGSPVDFPDPATVGYGFDFNPTVDRIRVVSGSGLNFRMNPNTGSAVDGDIGGAAGSVAGTNTDGLINGSGITRIEAVAYTNSFAQSLTGGVTTQYTLSSASNQLSIQNPPNVGTQTSPITVTSGGATLDFGGQTGFDIPPDVAVTASSTVAFGDGWMVTTVGGLTSVFRIELASGVATSTGAFPVGGGAAGLVVWAAAPKLALTSDAVTSIPGVETRITPLANDGLDDNAVITSASPGVIIEGRTLIIPAGFSGTVFYGVTSGATVAQGSITVDAGTALTNPTLFHGLLQDSDEAIVGAASVAISTKGVATVQVRGGTASVKAKASFPLAGNTASTFTKLGNLTLVKNGNGTVNLTLAALGGSIGGTLRAVRNTGTVEKHHIALASTDEAFGGGGYAIATVSKKGIAKIAGILPDGLPFSAATALRDNASIAFFTVVTKGSKPPGLLGGELILAGLATTDVSGELAYAKLPQLKGLHLGGVDTVLTANGCKFTGLDPLLTGAGTLSLSGGDLAVDESAAVAISTLGIPAIPTGALKTWKAAKGTFKATVQVPGITKPVKGSGLYLPKSNSAWGFFPGTSVGGRIELTVP